MKKQFMHEQHNRNDKALKSDYRQEMQASRPSQISWSRHPIPSRKLPIPGQMDKVRFNNIIVPFVAKIDPRSEAALVSKILWLEVTSYISSVFRGKTIPKRTSDGGFSEPIAHLTDFIWETCEIERKLECKLGLEIHQESNPILILIKDRIKKVNGLTPEQIQRRK